MGDNAETRLVVERVHEFLIRNLDKEFTWDDMFPLLRGGNMFVSEVMASLPDFYVKGEAVDWETVYTVSLRPPGEPLPAEYINSWQEADAIGVRFIFPQMVERLEAEKWSAKNVHELRDLAFRLQLEGLGTYARIGQVLWHMIKLLPKWWPPVTP